MKRFVVATTLIGGGLAAILVGSVAGWTPLVLFGIAGCAFGFSAALKP